MLLVVRQFKRPQLDTRRHRPRAALVTGGELLFHTALARILQRPPIEADVETLGDADAGNALALTDFDLVVCPASIVLEGGPAAKSALPAAWQRSRVVLFIEPEERDILPAALLSGAAGLFSRADSYDDFVEGVGCVLAGHMAIGPRVAEALFDLVAVGSRPPPTLPREMSAADRVVLAEVLHGASIAEIAEAHSVTPKTIRNRLSRIYQKLGVAGRRGRLPARPRRARRLRRAGDGHGGRDAKVGSEG